MDNNNLNTGNYLNNFDNSKRGYCIKCVQRIKDNYEKEMKKYTPMLEELKNVKKGIRDK